MNSSSTLARTMRGGAGKYQPGPLDVTLSMRCYYRRDAHEREVAMAPADFLERTTGAAVRLRHADLDEQLTRFQLVVITSTKNSSGRTIRSPSRSAAPVSLPMPS